MKKLLLSFVLSFIAICSFAQDHLSFKGIPIEGTTTVFCQKLKDKGFTYIGRDGNVISLKGEFAGRQATIGVCGSDTGDNVYLVLVFFDTSDEWNTLVNTYDHYKKLYTSKYGEPILSQEKNPAISDYNTDKMFELHQGTVKYMSLWSLPGGDIRLSIDKSSGHFEGRVTIGYVDSQNKKAEEQNVLDDI
ncbi:MAG: hypothetical protein ACI30P_01245 [Muribaculaceae bacterium]